MKQFCKLFGPDDNQILAMLTENEEGKPVINVYFSVEGLLPVKLSLGYDTEEKAEEIFSGFEESAIRDQITRLQTKFSSELVDDEDHS